MANQELTIEDIFRALNCFNESQRVEFLAQKTIEMKKILPKVDVLEALRDTTVINAGDTSNRHPCCNIEAFPSLIQISYLLENQMGFKKRGDSPTTIPQQFQLL